MNNITDNQIISNKGHVKYWNDLKNMAIKNRQNSTRAESKIWYELLNNNKTGYKFTKQKPINRFVLDFYCSKLLLAIEIDGSSHDRKSELDKQRDKYLNCLNILTIRFTNEEILLNINLVKQKLSKMLRNRYASLSREVDSDLSEDGRFE